MATEYFQLSLLFWHGSIQRCLRQPLVLWLDTSLQNADIALALQLPHFASQKNPRLAAFNLWGLPSNRCWIHHMRRSHTLGRSSRRPVDVSWQAETELPRLSAGGPGGAGGVEEGVEPSVLYSPHEADYLRMTAKPFTPWNRCRNAYRTHA